MGFDSLIGLRIAAARWLVVALAAWLIALDSGLAHAQVGAFLAASGEAASDFRLRARDGHPVALSQYLGKVVLVNFWAVWCVPCRAEMPALERLRRKVGLPGLAVLALDVGDDAGAVAAFFRDIGLAPGFEVLLDQDLAVAKKWQVDGMPTSFLIDADGRIRYMALGAVAFDSEPALGIARDLLRNARSRSPQPRSAVTRVNVALP
jgi:thiol-disulfide isomerase/thioredoxin